MSHTTTTDDRTFPGGHDGGFRHDALLYAGVDGLVESVVPWMRAGMEADEIVVALVPGRSGSALRDALGPDAAGAHIADMGEAGRNPTRLIAVWHQYLADLGHPRRPLRAVGEPVWPGRSPDEIEECRIHEWLINLAFADQENLWVRCPYDIGALDAEVVDKVGHSHPVVVGDDTPVCGYGGNPDAVSVLEGPLPPAMEPVQEEPITLATLRRLRASVRARAVAAGLGPQRTRDLVLAVIEVCSNSIVHGGGGGILRSWTIPGALIHEVNDAGHITDVLVGRRPPSAAQAAGRGLWLVNELCDLVQLRSSPTGTIVRMHMRTS